MIADEACWERGCACHDSRDSPGVELVKKREWVGLTDEEIHRTTVLLGFNPEWKTEIGMAHAVVRNLEAKLKERNG